MKSRGLVAAELRAFYPVTRWR